MAITKAIVEAHGGTIGVETTPGAGTIFTIRLPVAARAEATNASVRTADEWVARAPGELKVKS